MPKIVFLDRATIAPQIRLRAPAFPHELVVHEHTQPEQVVERLAGASIAIVNKVPLSSAALEQLPDLRLIAVAATGTDCIDKAYCQQRGIAVSNIRGYALNTVPEHTFALMLALRRNIVFGHHNLVTDRSFNEFHVIFCRNVMIYFNRQLQDRVHELLYSSLRRFGVLALGLKESLVATPHEHDYESLAPRMKLFRRRA